MDIKKSLVYYLDETICSTTQEIMDLISEEKNINLVYRGNTALLSMVKSYRWNKDHLTEYILQKGANVNIKDKNGWTALHHSIYNKTPHIVQRLIRCGANVDEPAGYNKPALEPSLSICLRYGQDCFKVLVENGIDLGQDPERTKACLSPDYDYMGDPLGEKEKMRCKIRYHINRLWSDFLTLL